MLNFIPDVLKMVFANVLVKGGIIHIHAICIFIAVVSFWFFLPTMPKLSTVVGLSVMF